MSTDIAPTEHEFEAAPGLPEPLPINERMLWQFSPAWPSIAVRAFHVRKLVIYFAALIALRFAFALNDGQALASAAAACAPLALLACLALGILLLLAWLSARSTLYTLTDRRVVMRIGIVLTITLNLPLARIDGAGARRYADGTSDIPLALEQGQRIAYLTLWPHVRPWRIAEPQPMLRGVPTEGAFIAQLTRALASTAPIDGGATTSVATTPSRSRVNDDTRLPLAA